MCLPAQFMQAPARALISSVVIQREVEMSLVAKAVPSSRKILLGAATALVLSCGPGPESVLGHSDGAGNLPSADETQASTAEALTVPPNGVAITLVGNTTYHMKNDTGVCAYWTGVGYKSWTKECSSTDATQLFAIYKMYDGDYNLCIPETLTSEAGSMTDSKGSYPSTIWRATCLETQKDASLVPVSFIFKSRLMSFKDRSGLYVAANNAQFKWSPPYIDTKGFNTRRLTKWTKKVNGPLYPEVPSSAAEWRWSFY